MAGVVFQFHQTANFMKIKLINDNSYRYGKGKAVCEHFVRAVREVDIFTFLL